MASPYAYSQAKSDTTKKKTDSLTNASPTRPVYRPRDRYGDPFSNTTSNSPFFLKDPKSFNLNLQIDTGMNYNIQERIGKVNFRPNSTMSFEEFNAQQNRNMLKEYWKTRSHATDGESGQTTRLLPKILLSPVLDRIFGGNYVELVPRGSVTLDFGANFQKIANPNIPIRQQRNGGFQFDQQINLSVVGKIGTKMKVTTNFDNNNSFDFQNNMKIEYTGNKEDILKKLEIGNVSLPLNNSLISGAQNLFGVKAQMQFGKLFVTALATTQRGKQSTIVVQGSNNGAAQGKPFEIIGSSYDENRHFFLSQFFRDHYESWLSTIPQISSGVNITRVEVYMLNRQNDTQTQRNVVGFTDLGESNKIYRKTLVHAARPGSQPVDNKANDLFAKLLTLNTDSSGIQNTIEKTIVGFHTGVDFENITSARKLATTEYTFNAALGYLTLQRKLANDEAVAVAYEYTYNGVAYKVGQLSEDYSNKPENQAVFLKLLRPRAIVTKDPESSTGQIFPTWNLMMKNIYNLNVTQLTRDGFQLRVIYRDDRTGKDIPQLQDGVYSRTKQLIEVMGLDKLNPYNDPQPDGNFDFVDNLTVNTQTGLIIFPLLEPFNEGLRNLFAKETDLSTRDYLINKYVYDTLYHSTQADAALSLDKNKFYITGSFKAGTGKDIIISGFNISQGSVKVYAGGIPLRENFDYTVDYTFGKVTILNDGILNSGKDITINYEQQDPFAFQTRSLLGTRLDYKLTDDINLGGTFLYYNERPLISRNLIGTEPARNMMYGLDLNVKKNSRLLTKLVDKLPFLETKEPSSVTFNAEFAQLLPGTSNLINGQGTSFIDDFENTATPYSLLSPIGWKLSAVPINSATTNFDEADGQGNNVAAGFKRAKLAWYTIDNLFYTDGGAYKPNNIQPEDIKNHYVRAIGQQEIFPYRDAQVGNFNEPILNISYFPTERGPYNYNTKPSEVNSDYSLKNPETTWGGITNAIRTEVDFDKANIEYIEFWMLDPFINSKYGHVIDGNGFNAPNQTGGKLVFNLGDISEDIMRDGKHAFENGLPTDGSKTDGVIENNWGYVTSQQFLNNAFDNQSSSRIHQDVGLDGASDADEKAKFSFLPLNDPSSDDFGYFLGDALDAKGAQIVERYKNINGMENNSPVLTGADAYAKSGTTIPDNEDLNQDNTVFEGNNYYTYNIDLKPNQLRVGNKYIVDKISPNPDRTNGDPITWYLFRIPIRDFDGQVGDMSGFKSIRYIRTYLTGWKEPVVLRLANFRSVGNRWRAYAGNLQEAGFGKPLEPNLDNVTVSAVNVEENGQGSAPVKPPYIEPLRRDRDNTSVVQRRLNEQSVQMCVDGLVDGDARAIYKSVSLDFFNYHHINMFFSAHGPGIRDNDVHGFIRLGTDFDQNYYEIEVPLKITNASDPVFNDPNNRGTTAVDAVWPDQNSIDLDLDELYALKLSRDHESFPLGELYPAKGPKAVGKHLIRVFGRPDLSAVKLMMIGVRNPRGDNTGAVNVCIWADELRLTQFDRTAGWAVNTVLNAKLADLGTVTTSLKHSTLGFGGVQSKIAERQRSDNTIFDISTNINVDKLLPKKLGLKIPMFASYESAIINPGYDPANPDVRIAGTLKSFSTDDQRSAYLHLIQDRSYKRSLNFTNVRKVKLDPKAASHPWDIENFSLSYAYSEATQTNFTILENTRKNVKGSVSYQYTSKFKGFEPFKKLKFLSNPNFQLLKDFNFNPFPTSISVRGELERSFTKTGYRSNQDTTQYNYLKYFIFNRYYSVRWNLTKALTLEYNAKANAIIDEPAGDVKGDSVKVIINNLKKGGRMKYFEQNVTVNYTLPFDKFPLTNWMGADFRENVGYNWTAGPLETSRARDTLNMGNIIRNTREQGYSGRVDFVKLYNKIGFLKDINNPKRKPTPAELAKQKNNKADTVKHPPDLLAVKAFLRLIMSLRNINATYTVGGSTTLSGFIPTAKNFGMDKSFAAPGWGFILGSQNSDIRYKARDAGWMTMNTQLTNPFVQSQMKDLGLKAALEPTADIKVQLDVKKTSMSSYQEIFRFSADSGRFVSLSPSRSGSYKISTISIKTAFKNNNSVNSSVFNTFKSNIATVRDRFTNKTGDGYLDQSQDVLIPAFIAAYTGHNSKTQSLSPFPTFPLPNWRIDFKGLNKIPLFSDLFSSITLNHAYSSSYSVLNFTNSLQYDAVTINKPLESYNRNNFASVRDADNNGQLVPIYVISQVTISEQFAPLIGVNIQTKSKVSIKAEYKTSRNLGLTISNAQITEMNTKDWSLEVGFTKNNMKLPFKDQGRVITLKNDITFKMTLAVTNTETIQRKIDDVATITNGNINFQLRPNINYIVNQKLRVQIYVDRNVNDPLVTSSYRRATTQIGTKIIFDLSQ